MSLTGQLRTRTEIRDGVGNLVLQGSPKAVFTSQRTRLNFGYKWDKLSVGSFSAGCACMGTGCFYYYRY
jgi:hypothetical protein